MVAMLRRPLASTTSDGSQAILTNPGNVNEHAFLWVGTPVDLATLGGPNSAVAWPNKNNHGQIAGITETTDMNPLNEAWSCAQANFPIITNHVCLGFAWGGCHHDSASPAAWWH